MNLLPIFCLGFAFLLYSAEPVLAKDWSVISKESSIFFSGQQSDVEFEGQFKTFSADITFDTDQLETSSILVTIDTRSAGTGDKVYDSTLPQKGWLNVGEFPVATYRAASFEKSGTDYIAHGELTLLGVTKDVDLPFTLSINGERAEANGTATLKRLDYGIGKEADPEGEWVLDTIKVTVHMVAVQKK